MGVPRPPRAPTAPTSGRRGSTTASRRTRRWTPMTPYKKASTSGPPRARTCTLAVCGQGCDVSDVHSRPHKTNPPPPPPHWREANRRHQRQTIRYQGLVPKPPLPPPPPLRDVFEGERGRRGVSGAPAKADTGGWKSRCQASAGGYKLSFRRCSLLPPFCFISLFHYILSFHFTHSIQ